MADIYEFPKARAGAAVLEKQRRSIEEARSAGALQHGRDELVMVVNEPRQIVYASPSLLEAFGESGFYGQRPGEYLRCVHAGNESCGLTDFCRFCGAAGAIANAQRTRREIHDECTIRTAQGGLTVTYNFKVRAIPLKVEEERYILVLLEDVSAEKHRAALERIFFHDILNTAAGLKGYLEILKRQVSDESNRELVTRLDEISTALIEEIQSQKTLASAENGTLEPTRQIIVSDDLVRSVIARFEQLDLATTKTLTVAPCSDSFSLISDETILRRILDNMVKNALEATGPGETVTVCCREESKKAVFEVHNSGVIPPETQSKIFSRFFSTRGDGRGLGTYSMKLLAEGYLGGQVSFTSTAEDGTTFSVSISLQEGS